MTRTELIDAGKIWQLYYNDDNIIFEGTKNRCLQWLKTNAKTKEYTTGKIRLGKVIWEKQ